MPSPPSLFQDGIAGCRVALQLCHLSRQALELRLGGKGQGDSGQVAPKFSAKK